MSSHQTKMLSQDDVLTVFEIFARWLCRHQIYAQMAVGGSAAIMLQISTARNAISDIDGYLTKAVCWKDSEKKHIIEKWYSHPLSDLIVDYIDKQNSASGRGIGFDKKYVLCAPLCLRKKDLCRLIPYASFRDRAGNGLRVVLVDLSTIAEYKEQRGRTIKQTFPVDEKMRAILAKDKSDLNAIQAAHRSNGCALKTMHYRRVTLE